MSVKQRRNSPDEADLFELLGDFGYEIMRFSRERVEPKEAQPYWDVLVEFSCGGRIGGLRLKEFGCPCCDPWNACMTWDQWEDVRERLRQCVVWGKPMPLPFADIGRWRLEFMGIVFDEVRGEICLTRE